MNTLSNRPPSPKGKGLYFPLFSIIALVLTLLVLLSISTYRHLHRGEVRLEESLFRDGQIILKSLEASFGTGMMGMMGRTDNLQEIMTSIATLSDIRFVALVDPQGIILAHNNPRLVGTVFPQKERLQPLNGREGTNSWFDRKGAFVVVKKLEPFLSLGMSEKAPNTMGFRMHSMMAPQGDLLDQVISGQVYAVVTLGTRAFEEARKNDLHHALLMGLILLVLGTAGFYFIFLVQNYYFTKRSLDSMTTYATQVVENMPDGLLSIDPEGNMVTANNRAKDLLAMPNDRLEKDEINNRLRPFLWPIVSSLKEKSPLLEQEVEFPVEPGKSIPLSLSAARLISKEGEDLGAVIILRDLREIKELREKMQRSEKLAGLGSLAAGMAHEIRNPLSSIKGFAQFFRKKNPPGSEGQKYGEVIIQEVDRLNRVITNLLDFARPKEPVKAPASMNEILDHTLALIRDDARAKGIDLITKEIVEDLPLLLMDQDQITQVLLNLTLNGLDVLKGQGTLGIRAWVDQGKKALVVEIADNGPGLSEEEISKIFDPFYTTKRTGTGLGLAIAYRIIEKHQGTLSVESKPGLGSIFRMALPLILETTNE